MAKKRCEKGNGRTPKTVLRLPDLDQAKSAVLNSLSSIDAQRGYRHAIEEFIEWYCSEPRLSFNRNVVLRYRMHLESRHLAPAPSIFISARAGQTSGTFSAQGNSVSSATIVNLNASYQGPLAPLGPVLASTTLTVSPVDVLKMTKPTWSTSTHILTFTATSTNAQSMIAVLNASGNVPIGTMANLGNANFSFQTSIASIASVNIKSNLGGATRSRSDSNSLTLRSVVHTIKRAGELRFFSPRSNRIISN